MRILILLSHILINSLFAYQTAHSDSSILSKQGWTYFNEAEVSFNNSIQEGLKLYQNALNIGKNVGDVRLIEYCYGRIAKINWHLAQYRKALLNLDSAILYCNKHDRCKSYQWYPLKAFCYYNLNEFNTALKILNEAEEEALAYNDFKALYDIYYERQRIYSKIDMLPLANKTIEKMLLLAQKARVKSPYALLNKLADIYSRRGSFKEAIALYEQAIDVISKNLEHTYRAKLLSYRYILIGIIIRIECSAE